MRSRPLDPSAEWFGTTELGVALGIGHERPDWQPVARIAMSFLDPAHAAADLGPRSAIARDGVRLRVGQPYSEAVFALDDARVEDTTLILDVSPLDGIPRRLFQVVQARDMAFAGC